MPSKVSKSHDTLPANAENVENMLNKLGSMFFPFSLSHDSGAVTDFATMPALRRYVGVFSSSWMSVFACLCRSIYSSFNRFSNILLSNVVMYGVFFHDFIKTKSSCRSRNYRVGLQSRNIGKFCNEVGFSFNRNFSCPSLVSLLFVSSRPFAVFWAIICVIINTLYRHARWRLSHVSNKVIKAMKPSVAYINASTSVVFKLLSVWIEASLLHGLPRSVSLWGFFKRHLNSLVCCRVENRTICA